MSAGSRRNARLFREDRPYGISGFSTRIPPLRDRLQDAPALDARRAPAIMPVTADAPVTSPDLREPLAESGVFPTLDDAMRMHIAKALARTNGRIEGRAGAAELLGLNPHTLRGKMRKLEIDWARFRHRATRP